MVNECRFFLLFLKESFFSLFFFGWDLFVCLFCVGVYSFFLLVVVVIMLFFWGVLPFAERQPGIHAVMTDHHHQKREVLAIFTCSEWKSVDMTAQHIWLPFTLPLRNQPQFSPFLFFSSSVVIYTKISPLINAQKASGETLGPSWSRTTRLTCCKAKRL